MKRTVKINFADMAEYQKKNNIAIQALQDHYAIEISDQPDFLFYNVYGTGLEHLKYKNCIKVFLGFEATFPNFSECDYALGRFDLSFGDRYCRFLDLQYDERYLDRSVFAAEDITKRRFCNFIYSNDRDGSGAVLRQQFCKALMHYKQVDCPGRVLHNMTDEDFPGRYDKNWEAGKRAFLQKYKFTIAFENQGVEGYTTEKMTDALRAGSVPIYWGNRRASEIFNRDAYIDATDRDMKEVIEEVIRIDRDDAAFRAMQTAPSILDKELFLTDWTKKKTDFILYIVEHGTKLVHGDNLLHDWTGNFTRKHLGLAEAEYRAKQGKSRLAMRIKKLIQR